MNKAAFLRQLGEKLASLPQSEISRTLNFYEESINDRMEDGMTEEEAIASLEDIDVIAERILLDNTSLPTLVKARVHQEREQRKNTPQQGGSKLLILLLLLLGFPLWFPLLLAFGSVILSVYILLWAVVVTLFVVLLALGLSALACLAVSFILLPYNGLSALLCFGGALLLAGLTILAWFPIYFCAKGLVLLSAKMGKGLLRGIKSLFIRKERK